MLVHRRIGFVGGFPHGLPVVSHLLLHLLDLLGELAGDDVIIISLHGQGGSLLLNEAYLFIELLLYSAWGLLRAKDKGIVSDNFCFVHTDTPLDFLFVRLFIVVQAF